jgi:hypothetical protein
MQYEVNRSIFTNGSEKILTALIQQDRTQQAALRSNTMQYEANQGGIFSKWLGKNTLGNRQLRAQIFEGNTTSKQQIHKCL